MDKLLSPLEWYTDKRRVSDLIPYEYNPRKRTPERIKKLKDSLKKFNLVEIPVINLDNTIIAGHQRVFALFEIGRGEYIIDVRIPNRMLTEEEFKEYNVRSNIGIGEWDIEMLIEHFSDFDFNDLGLTLDFELPEELIGGLESERDFEPELPEKAKTLPGDIYELISKQKDITHRIICGDSCSAETYKTLLESSKFQLIVTDPPYNIDYEGGGKERLKIKNDSMASADFYRFLLDFYTLSYDFSEKGCPIYVWHSESEGVNFRKALTDAGWKFSQCLIWVKNSLVLSRQDYHYRHEPCLQGEKENSANFELIKEHETCLYGWRTGLAHPWYSDRKQSTVLEFNRPTKSTEHPTMKPLDLILYQVKNSSKQCDVVGDLFLGSGTTLIASEQSWRKCYGIELDPHYMDVIVNRWVKYMRDNSLEYEVKLNGTQIEWEVL